MTTGDEPPPSRLERWLNWFVLPRWMQHVVIVIGAIGLLICWLVFVVAATLRRIMQGE